MRFTALVLPLLFAYPVGAVAAPVSAGVGPASERQIMNNPMPEDRFWALIARTTPFEAEPDEQLEVLHQTLAALSADEIVSFELAFQLEQRRAYTWELWGAAYVLNGGASDDGFEYFQRWLISKGRQVFEQALAKPDDLALILAPDAGGPCEFEEFAYVAGEVWSGKTGKTSAGFPYTGAPPAAEPAGTRFEEDDAYFKEHYPKLWARLGEHPLE